GRGHDATAVLREPAQLFAGLQVPETDNEGLPLLLPAAAGNGELAIRRNRHAKYSVRMALEAAEHFAGFRIPDAQVGIVAEGPLAVLDNRPASADDATVAQAERRGPGDGGDFLEPQHLGDDRRAEANLDDCLAAAVEREIL